MPHWLVIAGTVFPAVFLLELPDKTAVAAVLLATRHHPLPVFLGGAAAFVIQSAVAVFAGSLLGLLPRTAVRIGAGILFIVIAGLITWHNLRRQRRGDEDSEVKRVETRHHRVFVTAFLVIFVAEWGDLTQLATAALQAQYRQALIVFAVATLALWCVTAIAVIVGNRLGSSIPQRPLQYAGAAVMVLIGLLLVAGVVG